MGKENDGGSGSGVCVEGVNTTLVSGWMRCCGEHLTPARKRIRVFSVYERERRNVLYHTFYGRLRSCRR